MRTAALFCIVLVPVVAGAWLSRPAPAVASLSCAGVVSLVDAAGERLVCVDDPRLAHCSDLVAGDRVSSCVSLGPIRGPVLTMRGLPIDVNRASEEDLRAIPNVGAGMAKRIVEGRKDKPYCDASALERVKGVGPKRAAQLSPVFVYRHSLCEVDRTQ